MFRSVYHFIKDNKYKKLTIEAYLYSAVFRILILLVPPKKLEQHMGERDMQSAETETIEHYRTCRAISFVTNRICDKTSWESKCLVRALTAQRMLKKRHIPSTLYLGVGLTEDNKMIAHAWIRCGELYLTGGNGKDYAQVACFRA